MEEFVYQYWYGTLLLVLYKYAYNALLYQGPYVDVMNGVETRTRWYVGTYSFSSTMFPPFVSIRYHVLSFYTLSRTFSYITSSSTYQSTATSKLLYLEPD
jgi:hypothetical protein